jgi:hypothetical protein
MQKTFADEVKRLIAMASGQAAEVVARRLGGEVGTVCGRVRGLGWSGFAAPLQWVF